MKKFVLIFVVIALILTSLLLWQWDNIRAVFMSLTYSPEQIEKIVEEEEASLSEALKDTTQTTFYPLTEEENIKLQDGTITKEEALSIIKGENKKENATASKDTADSNTKEIDDIISEIYYLRSNFVGKLLTLENEAMRAASAMPKKDRTASKRLSFINYFITQATNLEKECDGEMNTLLERLKTVLNKEGKEISLISEIKSSYASQKSAKKSQLINKYSKYLK